MIKSGSNSESYTSLSSITLNIFQSTASSTIVLTIAIINILPITINLQITCDQTATFYYLLAVNQSLWRTTNFIRTQALLLLNYNSTDPYQEQFGFINMIEEQGTLATQLELLNLLPNMTYNLTGYCRSPLGTLSNIESLFFQAGGNGGKLYKVISNYSISMSTGLISSLGCFFNKLYKIPTQK